MSAFYSVRPSNLAAARCRFVAAAMGKKRGRNASSSKNADPDPHKADNAEVRYGHAYRLQYEYCTGIAAGGGAAGEEGARDGCAPCMNRGSSLFTRARRQSAQANRSQQGIVTPI